MSFQRNDKDIDKFMNEIVLALGKIDTSKNLVTLINANLSWFKNKSNITKAAYYQALDSEHAGKGSGIFYKHMSQFFELYM